MRSFKIFKLSTSILFLSIISFGVGGCAKTAFRGHNYAALGGYHSSKNDFNQAVHYYEKAVNEEPNQKSHLSLLGWAYFKQGYYDAAIATFERLAQIDPKGLDGYTGRGWSNFKKGDYDAAIGYFGQAIEIDPKAADPYNGIGWASFNKGDLDKAEKYFNVALRKGMKYQKGVKTKIDPEAHRGLGYLNFSKGDFKTAIEHLKMATLSRPDWNDARTKWGECLFSMGRYADALCLYRHCLKRAQNADIYDKIGWSYFQLAEKTETPFFKDRAYHTAKEMFNKALAINSEYATSVSGLSEVEKKITYDE